MFLENLSSFYNPLAPNIRIKWEKSWNFNKEQ